MIFVFDWVKPVARYQYQKHVRAFAVEKSARQKFVRICRISGVQIIWPTVHGWWDVDHYGYHINAQIVSTWQHFKETTTDDGT